MKAAITPTLLRNLPPVPAGKRYVRIFDTSQPGLILELQGSGGTYYVRVTDHRRRTRDMKIGRLSDVTLSQAKRRATELRAQAAMGQDPAGDLDKLRAIPTVSRFIHEQFLPYIRERQRGADNMGVYCRRIEEQVGSKPLDEVTPADVQALKARLREKGLANGTVNRHLAAIRSMINLAIRWKVVTCDNPASSPGMLMERSRDMYLTDEQAHTLFKALREMGTRSTTAAIAMLAVTGARRNEILRARWDELDISRRILTVPVSKSGKPRRIFLSDPAMQIIAHQARIRNDGHPYIFPGGVPGRPLNSVKSAWRRVKQIANLPDDLRVHDLRHSFASVLANRGVPLNEIGTLLGHSDVRMTARYAHHAPQRLIESANHAATSWGLIEGAGGVDAAMHINAK
jgi:integrase